MEAFSSSNIARGPGEILLKAQRRPVAITKNNKTIAIALCIEDYQELVCKTLPTEPIIHASVFHRNAKAVIETARKTPVLITKKTKPYIVLVSLEHYQSTSQGRNE